MPRKSKVKYDPQGEVLYISHPDWDFMATASYDLITLTKFNRLVGARMAITCIVRHSSAIFMFTL